MSDLYVTIGGKQVYPKPPASAELHAAQHAGDTTWEEGWQRETTRVSVPIGAVVLALLVVLILWRLLSNSARRRHSTSS